MSKNRGFTKSELVEGMLQLGTWLVGLARE